MGPPVGSYKVLQPRESPVIPNLKRCYRLPPSPNTEHRSVRSVLVQGVLDRSETGTVRCEAGHGVNTESRTPDATRNHGEEKKHHGNMANGRCDGRNHHPKT